MKSRSNLCSRNFIFPMKRLHELRKKQSFFSFGKSSPFSTEKDTHVQLRISTHKSCIHQNDSYSHMFNTLTAQDNLSWNLRSAIKYSPNNTLIQRRSYMFPSSTAHLPISNTSHMEGALVRFHIGLFGAMNVGKSMLMNAITNSEVSIVDQKAGTTADVKITNMQFHGLGAVKLFDTPGIDEEGELGLKKKTRAIQTLKEVDLAIIALDPFTKSTIVSAKELIEIAHKYRRKFIIIHNVNQVKKEQYLKDSKQRDINELLESIEMELRSVHEQCTKLSKAQDNEEDYQDFDLICYAVDAHYPETHSRLIQFIEDNATRNHLYEIPVLPEISQDGIVLLNIPMDKETPSGRLLRPQSLVQEHLIRNYVNTFVYRPDLTKARGKNGLEEQEKEKQRFLNNLAMLLNSGRMKLLITDSQCIDIISAWTKNEQGVPICEITTFSTLMINYMSGGRLSDFVKAIDVFKNLKKGDKVLICEACNHNRIIDDIGTVQIPNKIHQYFGEKFVQIDWSFGREYQTKPLHEYKLVIHCGGCLISKQKMHARLADLSASGVPVTNYGVLLSWFQSPETLERVINPLRNPQALMNHSNDPHTSPPLHRAT